MEFSFLTEAANRPHFQRVTSVPWLPLDLSTCLKINHLPKSSPESELVVPSQE